MAKYEKVRKALTIQEQHKKKNKQKKTHTKALQSMTSMKKQLKTNETITYDKH